MVTSATDFRQAEVSQFSALETGFLGICEQKVLRFDVAVNDAALMCMGERAEKICPEPENFIRVTG